MENVAVSIPGNKPNPVPIHTLTVRKKLRSKGSISARVRAGFFGLSGKETSYPLRYKQEGMLLAACIAKLSAAFRWAPLIDRAKASGHANEEL